MRKQLNNKKGFTLVELMVVVIIVGILAAVAVPLYRANTRKAMSSEGLAIVGSIRTAERVYYAEYDSYATLANLAAAGSAIDLTGNKYFTTAPTIASTATTFTATITGTAGLPGAGIVVTMDQDGTVTVTGL